jgi:hypothetical protein
MNNIKSILIIITILFTSFLSFAQPDCDRFLKKKCSGYGDPFKFSGQTKSALFEKGQTSSFSLVTYAGYEYNVSLCSDKKLKGIFFKIRETNPEKTVLYDSSLDDENYLEKQFYVKESKKLLVEVTVPEGELSAEDEEYEDRIGCVAVLIEYLKAPKKGFED